MQKTKESLFKKITSTFRTNWYKLKQFLIVSASTALIIFTAAGGPAQCTSGACLVTAGGATTAGIIAGIFHSLFDKIKSFFQKKK